MLSDPVENGGFELSWTPQSNEKVHMRVSVTSGGEVLGSSTTQLVAVETGPAPCIHAPAVIHAPAGDGAIIGGLYIAAPGVLECETAPYTLTATMANGAVAATQHVAARQSFVLLLPPGTYTLAASVCGGKTVRPVTLLAHSARHEDLVCARS